MQAKLVSFLLPLCHARKETTILAQVGTNPIFDRNVIGLVARFAVCLIGLKLGPIITCLIFFCSKTPRLAFFENGALKVQILVGWRSLLGRKIEDIPTRI